MTAATSGRSGGLLVVLDADSTLIREEAIELLAEAAGSLEHVAAVTERAMRGELDFAASLRERVATLAGLPVAEVVAARGRLTPTPGVQELIDGVRWPKLLTRRLRPYFYWVRGAVAGHKGDLDAAYDDYRTAYQGRLRDESDRSVLAALLAEIDVMRGDLASAREHLSAARTLKHREDLDPFLDELERRAAA